MKFILYINSILRKEVINRWIRTTLLHFNIFFASEFIHHSSSYSLPVFMTYYYDDDENDVGSSSCEDGKIHFKNGMGANVFDKAHLHILTM